MGNLDGRAADKKKRSHPKLATMPQRIHKLPLNIVNAIIVPISP